MEYDFRVAIVDKNYNVVYWVDEIGDEKAWEYIFDNEDYNFACFNK